ncbi:MAG: hypothetical protein CML17_02125 [Pusillimonas sp.]|nr:hypothetical protein [Pusillimonas sp.]
MDYCTSTGEERAGPGFFAPRSAILSYIPSELKPAVAAIEQVLAAVQPYASDDVNDWVTVTSHPGAEYADEIVDAAIAKWGGCPARAIYNHFGIEIDPNRVVCKPEQIGEWTVVQCFPQVALHKLQIVRQIASGYWPGRRLHQIIAREDFEANTAMFECGEDVHFLAEKRGEVGAVDDATAEIFARLKANYLANYQRFNGVTRYSTLQEADVRDLQGEWMGAD